MSADDWSKLYDPKYIKGQEAIYLAVKAYINSIKQKGKKNAK